MGRPVASGLRDYTAAAAQTGRLTQINARPSGELENGNWRMNGELNRPGHFERCGGVLKFLILVASLFSLFLCSHSFVVFL